MSSTQSRQVAIRAFAEEYNDATHLFKESDGEMAPKYALLPTGVRANRFFAVGTLTETGDVGNEDEYWKARVVDPSGPFFVYAGQYQPDVMSFIRNADPPAFVAVTGKSRTYETDDGNVNVTMRPERMQLVNADTKRNWVVETSLRTLNRIENFREADPEADGVSEDIVSAHEQYGDDLSDYVQAVDDAIGSIE